MNFDFGEVIAKAWKITWKHKVLWIFGILAGCNRGSGGNFNNSYSGNGSGTGSGPGSIPNLPPDVMRAFDQVEQNLIPIIAITVAVLCIFWLVAFFLGTIGKVGLIRGAAQADGGAEKLAFGKLWSESLPYFWRMFGLSLLVTIPVLFIVLVPLGVGIYFLVTASESASPEMALGIIPLFLGCLCLLVPVMWVIGMIVRQAENAIVLEDLGILAAVTRGWEVFKANLVPIILMTILLAVIGFAIGIARAIPVLAVVLPAMFTFILGEAESWTPLIIAGACLVAYIPVSMLANGILITYTESAWTLTYLRLTVKPEEPVIVLPEANA